MLEISEVLQSLLAFALFLAMLLSTLAILRARLSPIVALAAMPLVVAAYWAMWLEVLSANSAVTELNILLVAAVTSTSMIFVSLAATAGWKCLLHDVRRVAHALARVFQTDVWWRVPIGITLGLASLALVASLLVATAGAPNNGDSLGYRLPRIMWWLQEAQVGAYVSPDISQSTYPPLTEYLLLVVYGVSGSDLLLNLVQWVAGTLSVILIVTVAWMISRSSLAAISTFVLVATIPTGLTQLTTTQSDWVASLWPVVALTLVVARATRRIALGPYLVLLALSGALTFATKPTTILATGLIAALGVLWEARPVLGSVDASRSASLARTLAVGSAFLVGCLLGGVPQVLRNVNLTGSILGVRTDIFVESPTLGIMWANSIRTLVNNLGIPPPLSDPMNRILPQALAVIGVPTTDPNAIHLSNVLSIGLGRNEDLTTNPIHLVLGLGLALIVLFMPGLPRLLRPVTLVGVLLFFFSNGLLQWQEWSTRFFLPSMVIFSIPVGWVIARWLQSTRRWHQPRGLFAMVILAASACYGLAISVAQEYRPLVGSGSILTSSREDQYFRVVNRPGAPDTPREVLMERIRVLSKLPPDSTIGLYKFFGQEYLAWRFLNPDGRYTFVNMQDLNGKFVVDPDSVDGTLCERECP